MQCSVCQAVVKKGSNFCRYCGHQMPVLIGASFPFGIRFPSGSGKVLASAINQARSAPRYFEEMIERVKFHVALYDRTTVADLAVLYQKVFSTFRGDSPVLIEHTTDGRHFFTGPSFWGCLARRLGNDEMLTFEEPQPGTRCHSYFGCLAAQKRQHQIYHREGWEVFYNGRHGFFPGGDSDEFKNLKEQGRELVALGEEIDRTRFVLDRAKVRAETMNLIRRAGAHRCPLFSPSHFDKAIRRLPSVVFVGEDPGWEFLNCAIHGPAVRWRCYEERAVEIEAGVKEVGVKSFKRLSSGETEGLS